MTDFTIDVSSRVTRTAQGFVVHLFSDEAPLGWEYVAAPHGYIGYDLHLNPETSRQLIETGEFCHQIAPGVVVTLRYAR